MGRPAAKQGDEVEAMDTHIVVLEEGGVPVESPMETPFTGIILGDLSEDVMIDGLPAATLGSTAQNDPDHIPEGGPWLIEPTNTGEIVSGSASVLINGRPAARAGDTALTCNDPAPLPIGTVIAESTVLIGD